MHYVLVWTSPSVSLFLCGLAIMIGMKLLPPHGRSSFGQKKKENCFMFAIDQVTFIMLHPKGNCSQYTKAGAELTHQLLLDSTIIERYLAEF